MYTVFVFFSLIVFLEGAVNITSPDSHNSTIAPELTRTQQTNLNVSAVQPQTSQKTATPESSTTPRSLPELSITTRITPKSNTTEKGTPESNSTTIGSSGFNTTTTGTPDSNITRQYSTTTTTEYTPRNDTTTEITKQLGNSTKDNGNSKETANKTNSTAGRVNETAPNKVKSSIVAPSTGEPKWKVILITALVVTTGFCCVIVVKHMFRTWRGRELPRNYEVQYLVLDHGDEIPLTRPVNSYY